MGGLARPHTNTPSDAYDTIEIEVRIIFIPFVKPISITHNTHYKKDDKKMKIISIELN